MTACVAVCSKPRRRIWGKAALSPTALTLPLPVIPAFAGIQRINKAIDFRGTIGIEPSPNPFTFAPLTSLNPSRYHISRLPCG